MYRIQLTNNEVVSYHVIYLFAVVLDLIFPSFGPHGEGEVHLSSNPIALVTSIHPWKHVLCLSEKPTEAYVETQV